MRVEPIVIRHGSGPHFKRPARLFIFSCSPPLNCGKMTRKKNMISGLNKAIELYKPDGIPVSFDLQLEAEILGCKLNWAKENPPAGPLAQPLATRSLS